MAVVRKQGVTIARKQGVTVARKQGVAVARKQGVAVTRKQGAAFHFVSSKYLNFHLRQELLSECKAVGRERKFIGSLHRTKYH